MTLFMPKEKIKQAFMGQSPKTEHTRDWITFLLAINLFSTSPMFPVTTFQHNNKFVFMWCFAFWKQLRAINWSSQHDPREKGKDGFGVIDSARACATSCSVSEVNKSSMEQSKISPSTHLVWGLDMHRIKPVCLFLTSSKCLTSSCRLDTGWYMWKSMMQGESRSLGCKWLYQVKNFVKSKSGSAILSCICFVKRIRVDTYMRKGTWWEKNLLLNQAFASSKYSQSFTFRAIQGRRECTMMEI